MTKIPAELLSKIKKIMKKNSYLKTLMKTLPSALHDNTQITFPRANLLKRFQQAELELKQARSSNFRLAFAKFFSAFARRKLQR